MTNDFLWWQTELTDEQRAELSELKDRPKEDVIYE